MSKPQNGWQSYSTAEYKDCEAGRQPCFRGTLMCVYLWLQVLKLSHDLDRIGHCIFREMFVREGKVILGSFDTIE